VRAAAKMTDANCRIGVGGALRCAGQLGLRVTYATYVITTLTVKFGVAHIAHRLDAAKACMLGTHVRAASSAWRCPHGAFRLGLEGVSWHGALPVGHPAGKRVGGYDWGT